MKASVIAICLALLSVGALAQDKTTKPKPVTAVKCPNCHMDMAKKKDKAHTVAVRLKKNGPVLYCCAGCKMPDKILVKPKKKA